MLTTRLLGSRNRGPLATAALAIAILALLVAPAGGSYAAGRYLDTTASKSRPQVRRGPRGRRGEAGPPGPAGPPGWPEGAPGLAGTSGENLIARLVQPGNLHCETGGTEFKVPDGNTSFTCNGGEGARGKEGPAWPPGGTLPPGDTESGTWEAGPSDRETAQASISFPIPLPFYVTATTFKCEVRNFNGECFSRYCPPYGPVEGFLCISGVEPSLMFNPETNQPGEAGTTGAVLVVPAGSSGSWVVRAGQKG